MVDTRYFPAPLHNSLIVFSSYDVLPNNYGFSKLDSGLRKRMSMENYRKRAVFEREFSAAEICEWERFLRNLANLFDSLCLVNSGTIWRRVAQRIATLLTAWVPSLAKNATRATYPLLQRAQ